MEPAIWFFIVVATFVIDRGLHDQVTMLDEQRKRLNLRSAADETEAKNRRGYIAEVRDAYGTYFYRLAMMAGGLTICYVQIVHPVDVIMPMLVTLIGIGLIAPGLARFQRDHVLFADQLEGKPASEFLSQSILLEE